VQTRGPLQTEGYDNGMLDAKNTSYNAVEHPQPTFLPVKEWTLIDAPKAPSDALSKGARCTCSFSSSLEESSGQLASQTGTTMNSWEEVSVPTDTRTESGSYSTGCGKDVCLSMLWNKVHVCRVQAESTAPVWRFIS